MCPESDIDDDSRVRDQHSADAPAVRGVPTRLRVVWSMLNLNPGFMGGTEEYASGLLRELIATDVERSGATQIVTLTTEVGADFAPEGVEGRVVRGLPGGRSFARRSRVFIAAALRTRALRRHLDDAGVIFYPFTAMMPHLASIPSCVLVHDLQHLELPANFTVAQRVYRSLTYDRRITRASAIVAVSESTRASLIFHLRIPGDRISVIPPGIDGRFFTPLDDRPAPTGGEYLYYPARGLPHKNHATLFEAFAMIRASRPELRLVLTGGDRELLGTMPEGVEHEGRVSRERVRELYRGASALVFPSLFEGYGLPPLEAMGCGTPVASSTAGSLPEVCGDAVEYFSPESATEMAEAIRRVLDNPEDYRRRGLAHVATRTIAHSARAYETLWTELASA